MRWAARLFTTAFATSVRPAKRRPTLTVQTLERRDTPTVSGLVFVDLNQDGTQDAGEVGVPDIVVTGTLPDNTVVSTTTDAGGNYTLDTAAPAVRVQFSAVPEGLVFGKSSAGAGAAVRFLDASADPTAVNLGLNTYLVALNTYFYDKATTGVAAGEGAIITVDYAADGVQTPVVLATNDQVGATFGLTYHAQSDSVYASSFVKRHAGLGPNTFDTTVNPVPTTTGGVYRIDRANANAVSLLIDLNAVPAAVLPAGSTAANFATGADPHPADADIDGGDWLHDAATVPLVGKRGLGGLAASADGRTLYTVNLVTRQLIEIPINVNGTLDTTRALRRTTIPLTDPGVGGAFDPANMIPFAVAVKGNAVFVGVTYTAQGQAAANLRALVYAFNPATGAFAGYNASTGGFAGAAAPVINAPLNYARKTIDPADPAVTTDDAPGAWRPWVNTFTTQPGTDATAGVFTNPQPWLTDIAFDGTAMTLGLRDRFGDMGGFQTYSTVLAETNPINTVGAGDVLRASVTTGAAAWTLESNGTAGGVTTGGAGDAEGPGGGEFYYQDNFAGTTTEVMTGGLAQVPGYKTVISTGIDAGDANSGGVYTLLNADTDPSAAVNTAGTTFAVGQTYLTSDFSTFGSANGVGNAEILAASADLQVGDRVFNDANANGIQDAGEAGLAAVTLGLFKAGTQVSSTATDAAGNYLFDALDPNTAYEIRLVTTQTALTGRTLSPATQGTNTAVDSNATVAGTTATIAFTTGAAGTSDHTLDAGFSGGTPPGPLTLGNQVFVDANNNGLRDGAETGIAGITVQLINNAAPTTVIATATTAATGLYTFPGLNAGDYVVRIAAANFNTGNVLAGYTSSGAGAAEAANTPDPDTANTDNDDNGLTDTTAGALGAGGFIRSLPITLTAGGEPITDGDTDANTNLTLDFGIVAPAAAATLTLGNQVFVDANNNGLRDGAEAGLAGVTVQLFNNTAPNTVVASMATAANGLYTFPGLAAGTYFVRVPASNFATGAVLAGYTSSLSGAGEAANTPNPDLNVNDDDNGLTNTAGGALGAGGFIQSGTVALALGAEPVNDGDTDANTNLSLDFGVVAPAAAGTLSLGNTVFNDANDNGLLDPGESGIQGVTVQLLSSAGAVLQAAATVAGGQYTFTGLAEGSYSVRLAASNFNAGGVLVGYTSSVGVGGAYETSNPPDPNNNVDGDDNGITDTTGGALGAGGFIQSNQISLDLGQEPTDDGDASADTNLTLDFGVRQAAVANTLTLGNQVFVDTNNNGLRDTGETGLPGVTVQLINNTAPTTVVASTVTGANGIYTFGNLAPGAYRARLAAINFNTGGVLAGYTSSLAGATEAANTPNPDLNVNDDDNGLTDTTNGALGAGGFVVSGPVSLALGGEPITDGDTDANTNLTLDFGVVAPAAAGTLTLGNQVFVDTNNNGTKDTGEVGLAGVTVQLVKSSAPTTVIATAVTAANGIYTFPGLAADSYRVRLAAANFNTGAVLAGYTSSLAGATEAATAPNANLNVDNDDNGVTDTTGGALGSGGFVQSGDIILTVGGEINDGDADANANPSLDFGVVAPVTAGASISGRTFLDYNNDGLFNGPDTGLAGVTLTLTGIGLGTPQTATSDASGNYTFSGLAAGSYTVTETQPTTPANQSGKARAGTGGGVATVNNVISGISLGATTQATGNTFAEVPLVSTGGFVYEDANGNGTKDTGEAGIPGVTVTLTGSNVVTGAISPMTATTDATGAYTFANLLPGTYTLAETQPTGFNDGAEQNGTPTGATVQADRFVGINLSTSAATSGGFNFGEIKTGSLAGIVFADANNNGTQDTGETGIAGVTVKLTGTSNGAAVTKTATTGTDGTYTFTNLGPGTYTVTETQPAGYLDGIETVGTAAGTATDNTFTGIALTSGTAATGYLFAEQPAPDLVVALASSPARPKPGALVTLTYTVRNTGTATATAATLTASLAGLTFVSSSAAAAYNATTGVWTVGDVAAGATMTMTVTARVPRAGTFRPSATVAATNPEISTANNTATTVVNAGLGITLQSYLSSTVAANRSRSR